MKKTICIILSALMTFAVLSGCQKTPDNPIVVGKNAENLIEQATADDGSAALSLREQLSAPERLDVTVEEDHFTILAHAAVRLPETDTIPIITVKAGSFSQELINGLWDLLIRDKNMYKPRTEADRTKTELEQAILTLQSDMERIEQNEYYEENKALREAELAHLRELYSTAPDTYEPTAVTPEIEQYVDSGNPSRRFMGVDATDNAGTVFRVSNESWYEPLGKGGIQNSKFVYCTPGHNGVVHGKNSTKEVKENDTLDNTAYPGLSMQPKQARRSCGSLFRSWTSRCGWSALRYMITPQWRGMRRRTHRTGAISSPVSVWWSNMRARQYSAIPELRVAKASLARHGSMNG